MSENKSKKASDIIVIIILSVITLAAIITAIVMIALKTRSQEPITPPTPPAPSEPVVRNPKVINIAYDFDEHPVQSNGQIFDNYNDLSAAFPDSIDEKLVDFDKNYYALFRITYDECNWGYYDIDYVIEDSTYNVTVTYDEDCGVCADINEYFLIPIGRDANTQETPSHVDINVKYAYSGNYYCTDYPVEEKKPIIYLYPTHTTDISVKLGRPELITSSYPKYTSGWNVTAEPSGKLTDRSTGRELYSLYWEGKNRNAKMHRDGFIVKGSDTASFLEEKLATLGLTEREAEEFIIYWLPILEVNNYNYIRFETAAEINAYMPLEINPQPDTLIRVIMDYKPLNTPINITEQRLTTPTRAGFIVVEWCGTEIK